MSNVQLMKHQIDVLKQTDTKNRVAESESISVDLKALENKEPDLYKDLVNDYPKVTTRKASIRISVK